MRHNVVNMREYFNEYYKQSDIDVMCNKQSYFEYIETANNFANKINDKNHNLNDDYKDYLKEQNVKWVLYIYIYNRIS